MKIWITGGNGMLASHFKRFFVERKIPFVANDVKEVDITHHNQVSSFAKTEKITHIINCAAYTNVDKAEVEKDLAFLVNAKGPQTLGKIAKEQNLKVIHFSTDYVFNGLSSIPYTENSPCSPIGVYGQSKWEGEQRLFEETSNACIIRTSWLFGLPGKNFVETMIKLMLERETLRVVNDQIGCPTYCQDLAEASFLLLNKTGLFHFANKQETSWYGFANEIRDKANKFGFSLKVMNIEPIKTSDYPTPAKRPAYSTLSTEKFEKTTKKNPRPWPQALESYFTQRTSLGIPIGELANA